ncbi:MAG: hypothetical protein AAFO73_07890, partial [Pseudomonadota bacterium]
MSDTAHHSSRRRFLASGAVWAGVGLSVAGIGGCSYRMLRPIQALAAAPAAPAPVSKQFPNGIRLHMIQTGWVAVKREHRAFSGPTALRLPAIMASRTWTEWMPVTTFIIEHPEGLIAVDTGESAKIAEPDYTACDG